MNLLHHPSFKLCKKLTEIGFPATELFYTASTKYGRRKSFISDWENNQPFFKNYKCPSVMEMLDIIPKKISDDGIKSYWFSILNRFTDDFSVHFGTKKRITENTLPNALAEMILWLVENGYINFNAS